jgi:NADPH-dependent 2,4-dienoyl-CoA reductase/sulfur reductase-like enzyme/rhodanese-related sulfurtransferase
VSDQRIVVLGASAAGLKAAARARRLLPDASITIVDRRDLVSIGACGLPHVLSGEVDSIDALRRTSYGVVRDVAWFAATRGLELMTGCEILGIDRDKRAVSARCLADQSRHMILYDQLVYALGSRPRLPAGIALGPAVVTGRTPEEITALRGDLEQGRLASAVIVGAGLVGLEMAGALSDLWGCEVTVLESADQVLPRVLDPEMAELVQAHLERQGVPVRLGAQVTAAETTDDGRAHLTLAGGETLTADRALVAVGVEPNTDLARATGLALGDQRGLVVDANLRTSDPDILACGDCVELVHHVTGAIQLLPLGSLATRQGRVAGDVLAGYDSEFPAVVGSVATRVLGLEIAATGLSLAEAQRQGLAVASAWGVFDDRSSFHPDRQKLYLEVVYEVGCRRLVGLQAIGPGDATGRVDVFASLLRQDADLEDLLDVEWCYAPPLNAALDPLHGLAGAALNTCGSRIAQHAPAAPLAGLTVLDVRTADEFAAADGHALPGAVNIPIEELRGRLDELPAGDVVVVCAKGPRSVEAARLIAARGDRDVRYLAGGVEFARFGRRDA